MEHRGLAGVRQLAQALGSDQPFYAIEPYSLIDIASPHRSRSSQRIT